MFRIGAKLVAFLALAAFLAACERTPLETDFSGLQFAKGGKPGKPSMTVVDYQVNRLGTDQTHSLTDDVNLDAQAFASFDDGDTFLCGPEGSECEPADFFGCPDPAEPCNEILFTYEGQIDAIRFDVAHSIGGEGEDGGIHFDTELGNSHLGANSWQSATPVIPVQDIPENPDGTKTVRVYWQGQRRSVRWDEYAAEYVRIWNLVPDQDHLNSDDSFLFKYTYTSGKHCPHAGYGFALGYPEAWAVYRGNTGGGVYTVMDQFALDTLQISQGRGKGATTRNVTYLTWDVQSFDEDYYPAGPPYEDWSTSPGATEPPPENVEASHRMKLGRPHGSEYVAFSRSIGLHEADGEKPALHKTTYREELTASGCYQLTLIGAYVFDGRTHLLRFSWDSEEDPVSETVAVTYDADAGTLVVQPGEYCSGG